MSVLENKPLVSIIISTYNRKETIGRALRSVFLQTYKNYELIIVDDGSTDGEERIISPLIRDKPNCLYVRIKHQGAPYAKNFGIIISRAPSITFLDSDDEYKKDHIQKRVEYMRKHPKIDLTHSAFVAVGRKEDMYVVDARDHSKLIHVSRCMLDPTLFGKRGVFIKLRGFRDIYGEGYDFLQRAKRRFNVRKLPYKTYIYYRMPHKSVTHDMKKQMGL